MSNLGMTSRKVNKPRVVIAGLGLIGGSFYKASIASEYDTTGLHHNDSTEPLKTADIILVCMPPNAIVPWIKAHSSDFKKGSVVVDICGTKRSIMRDMARVRKDGWYFVGGHPMAGREVSGFENSLADLFQGASMLLVPEKNVNDKILSKLKRYFKSVGFSMVVVTTARKHDEMIAFTSQLCHVIATSYSRDKRVQDAIGFSAGSYANMTRIATQNADDWSNLYLANKDMLVKILDGFISRMSQMRDAVKRGDCEALKAMIVEGTKAKTRELESRRTR